MPRRFVGVVVMARRGHCEAQSEHVPKADKDRIVDFLLGGHFS
jgi:hypothetical protein